MKKPFLSFLFLWVPLLFLAVGLAAQPEVSNVRAAQVAGTGLVEITYDLASPAGPCTVSLRISADGGASFNVPAHTLSGAVGAGIVPGTDRVITWDAGADWPGQYSARMRFRVIADDGVADAAPVITSAPLATGRVGEAFEYQITATNAPEYFTASNLPAGLSVDVSTGLISGVPESVGLIAATVTAGNSFGFGQRTLQIEVLAAFPVITSASTATGVVGQPFLYEVRATNEPTAFTAVGLPPGLLLDETTGLITGEPDESGTSTVVLRARNAGGLGPVFGLTLDIRTTLVSEMVLVEGGSLPAVSTLGDLDVSAFYIGRYEVTWGEWQTVRTWAASNGYDIGGVGAGCAEDHPVHSVNWYEVIKWCNAKSEMEGRTPVYTVSGEVYRTGETVPGQNLSANGYRLPLEAEWEFAARGGVDSEGFAYAGSNDLNEVGWFRENSTGGICDLQSGRSTWAVGLKGPNELGLYDVSGNVWEWCWDGFNSYRRVRGGSWNSVASRCDFIFRNHAEVHHRDLNLGFRVVSGSPPVPEVTSASTASGVVGQSFSYQITASNTPTSYTASGLPTGLSVDTATGVISGVPEVSGTSTVVLRARNADGLGPIFALTLEIREFTVGEMVLVEGGTLSTSSELDGTQVNAFYIGRYAVTWEQWQVVRTWAAANGYAWTPAESDFSGIAPSGCAADHPVHSVNWFDALKWSNAKSEMKGLTPVYTITGAVYRSGEPSHVSISQDLSANGYRLPMEAEWEFAARGGNETLGFAYAGSDDLDAVGWYRDNSDGATCNLLEGRGTMPVGQKAANELGLYDMSGNVWDWCWDRNGSVRHFRGGGWNSESDRCSVSSRNYYFPDRRFNFRGFRLARTPSP